MIGFVTGAGKGLGLEMVKLGLEMGHTIVATCHKDPLSYPGILELSKRYGEKLVLFKMDVTNEDEVAKVSRKVRTRLGKVDFLVNSAGVLFESKYFDGDAIADIDISVLRKTLEVNTVGPAIVLKHFIKLIYASDNPCILNVSSEAANLPTSGYRYLAYSVSKAAENMYSQMACNYLREERKEHQIRIYMIHPGRMDTEMGKENAQISAKVSAVGLYEIIDGRAPASMKIPFIDYLGNPMLG